MTTPWRGRVSERAVETRWEEESTVGVTTAQEGGSAASDRRVAVDCGNDGVTAASVPGSARELALQDWLSLSGGVGPEAVATVGLREVGRHQDGDSETLGSQCVKRWPSACDPRGSGTGDPRGHVDREACEVH